MGQRDSWVEHKPDMFIKQVSREPKYDMSPLNFNL